ACDWLQLLGVKESMLKDGGNGAVGDCDGQRTRVAASPVHQVVDTTSAGDAFNGGYLAGRLQGLSTMDAARYAARLAAFVVGQPGAIAKAEAFANFDTLP
ncbi:PfkB family carbohydrate kinase, partial [Alkalimonas sp.]|uniref:PfkB family carbohydrate kinase n=1 Tax=Alkalimonas sp. TaxID=1872453 RepID=UPI0026024571